MCVYVYKCTELCVFILYKKECYIFIEYYMFYMNMCVCIYMHRTVFLYMYICIACYMFYMSMYIYTYVYKYIYIYWMYTYQAVEEAAKPAVQDYVLICTPEISIRCMAVEKDVV